MLDSGTIVRVGGGPRTADGFTWWNISSTGWSGWAAEGDGVSTWLAPYSGPPPTEVPPTIEIAPPPSTTLSSPNPISPPNGALLTSFPRTTTLNWSAVTGASSYRVRIQYCSPGGFTDCTDYPLVETGSTSHTFNFVGDQPGRWRVWAVAPDGTESEKSAWWTFSYDTSSAALGPPNPLSPADGTVFDHFPRETTLSWSSVSGASSYGLEVQFCSPGGFTDCTELITETTGSTSHTFNFVGAQPGRWRVWAIGPGGTEGPKSDWRTFRYTR